MELATAESQHPVLLLEDGDGEEEEDDGWCWSRHWATAKPAREEGRTYTRAGGGSTPASSPPKETLLGRQEKRRAAWGETESGRNRAGSGGALPSKSDIPLLLLLGRGNCRQRRLRPTIDGDIILFASRPSPQASAKNCCPPHSGNKKPPMQVDGPLWLPGTGLLQASHEVTE